MKQMTQSELTTVRNIAQAHGALTLGQASGVAKARSCPRCAGLLTVDTDPLGEDDSLGTFAFGRLVCLQGGHEIAEVKRDG